MARQIMILRCGISRLPRPPTSVLADPNQSDPRPAGGEPGGGGHPQWQAIPDRLGLAKGRGYVWLVRCARPPCHCGAIALRVAPLMRFLLRLIPACLLAFCAPPTYAYPFFRFAVLRCMSLRLLLCCDLLQPCLLNWHPHVLVHRAHAVDSKLTKVAVESPHASARLPASSWRAPRAWCVELCQTVSTSPNCRCFFCFGESASPMVGHRQQCSVKGFRLIALWVLSVVAYSSGCRPRLPASAILPHEPMRRDAYAVV